MTGSPPFHGSGDVRSGAPRVLWVGRTLIVLLSLTLLGLLGRVVQLKVDPSAPIAALVDSQHSSHTLMGRRGSLLDRRGRVLATTSVAERLFVDPYLIRDHSTFAERVGYGLGYSPVRVATAIASHPQSRYIVLDKRLNDKQLQAFSALDLPGLSLDPDLVREYPCGPLAGQVIGFVGADGRGLEGMERKFNPRLAGSPGELSYLRDAHRQPLWVTPSAYQPEHDGQAVRLSIDITIQAIAEKYLHEAVTKFGADSGQLVVMQPDTGEILAMANDPSFNPNDFKDSKPSQWRNRAVTDVFEPGSIFKPVIWSAATQLGAAKPDEMIDTTSNGVWRTPVGRRLRDAEPNGIITWDKVLIVSSNIGMAKVANRLGNEKLYRIVKAFGFGEPTGSGLPGEVGGIVHPLSRWTAYSTSSIPMGQEIGVTALQMVRAFSAIANGGTLVTPTILALDPSDPLHVPIRERILLPSIAAHTRAVLRRVVTEGTGRRANSDLYKLFGKTGTAQLPNLKAGGYYQHRYQASFIAGAPLEHPRIVVGCFIHDPDRSKGHYGGTVAAPAVRHVIERTLMYLGVPSDVQSNDSNAHRRVHLVFDDRE